QIRKTPPRGAFCVSGGERGVDEASGSTNSSGTNLDSRRLALERAARKGELHGWSSQSLASSRPNADRSAPSRGVLRIWQRDEVWTKPLVTRHILCLALRASSYAAVRSGILPPRATNSSGTNLDSRRLALERAARKGELHGWSSQSLAPGLTNADRSAPPRRAFCVSGGERGVDETSGDSAQLAAAAPALLPKAGAASVRRRLSVRCSTLVLVALLAQPHPVDGFGHIGSEQEVPDPGDPVFRPVDQDKMRGTLHRAGAVEDQHRRPPFDRTEGEPPFRHFRVAREIGNDLVAPVQLQPVHQVELHVVGEHGADRIEIAALEQVHIGGDLPPGCVGHQRQPSV